MLESNQSQRYSAGCITDIGQLVTCVDPRVFPEQILGLEVGEAFVFRTVAGHPHSTVEDIAAVSIQGHDCVENVIIIHHTGKFSRSTAKA